MDLRSRRCRVDIGKRGAKSAGFRRQTAAGFQISNGQLLGPHDMFKDVSFDPTRQLANSIGDYMRRAGPFEPHRLPLDQMEYTTLPLVMAKLKGRFQPLDKESD